MQSMLVDKSCDVVRHGDIVMARVMGHHDCVGPTMLYSVGIRVKYVKLCFYI